MNGRKREGTVEVLRGQRTLRRRKRTYKAQAEVAGDAAWEVGRGHNVAMKAGQQNPLERRASTRAVLLKKEGSRDCR
jgi:hypothetical protein